MTVQEIKQYIYFQREIRNLNDEIGELRDSKVTSVVSGSYDAPPYTKHSIKVQGNGDRIKSLIAQKKAEKDKLTVRLSEIQTFVDAIPDAQIRRIVRLKYLETHSNGKRFTWAEIANKLGGYNTADGVRKACKRFFQKN